MSDTFNWMGDYGNTSSSLGDNDWGDYFGTGNTSSWAMGDSESGGWGNFFRNLLGGNDGTDGNIWGQILAGGLSGFAEAGMTEEMLKMKGEQDRKSLSFEAELVDYYKQKDKSRKRAALDTYGQFSTMKRWAPQSLSTPAIDVPNKPTP